MLPFSRHPPRPGRTARRGGGDKGGASHRVSDAVRRPCGRLCGVDTPRPRGWLVNSDESKSQLRSPWKRLPRSPRPGLCTANDGEARGGRYGRERSRWTTDRPALLSRRPAFGRHVGVRPAQPTRFSLLLAGPGRRATCTHPGDEAARWAAVFGRDRAGPPCLSADPQGPGHQQGPSPGRTCRSARDVRRRDRSEPERASGEPGQPRRGRTEPRARDGSASADPGGANVHVTRRGSQHATVEFGGSAGPVGKRRASGRRDKASGADDASYDGRTCSEGSRLAELR